MVRLCSCKHYSESHLVFNFILVKKTVPNKLSDIWLEQRYSSGFGYQVWKSQEVLCARQHSWHQQTCSCTTQDQLLDLLNPLVQSSVSIMNIELIVHERIWPGPIAQDFTMMSPVVAKNCCSKHWYTVCFCCTPAVRCYHLICHLISSPLVISCLWQDWSLLGAQNIFLESFCLKARTCWFEVSNAPLLLNPDCI
jgi:hypothetical protein